ncbi:MAG: cell wall hydrolase [Candidatus Kuenenbacteria bacterium]
MQQILEEKLSKIIKEKEFKWNFEIKEQGIYGIEITGSAKSWQQNGLKSFFKDDNLAVKIDDLKFSKKSINWNGNNLKGLKKTNFFIIKFDQENHNLFFFANQTPKIETIRIFKIDESEISYLPKDNYPIEQGDRRQWITIVLYNLGLNFLKIKALAKEGKKFLFFQKDDSDLKLIINGEIQKNQEPKSHKNWYWCNRILKGNSKTFEKELNLKPNLHYIELWADRNPEIEEINLKIEKPKRIPTVDDPKWTENFKDDSEEIILARVIFGEARSREILYKSRVAIGWSIRNRLGTKSKWGPRDTYHQIILEPKQYSTFNILDSNFPYVIDPLFNINKAPLDKEAWYECYKIAGKVIKREIEDPTNGANHYYDDSIQPPFWTKAGEFKIKINNLEFYYLK